MAVIVPIVSKFDQKGVKNAQKAFGGLSKSLKSTIGSLGVGLGLAAITNGLKNMAKAAVEDSKSVALLANTLRNTTQATDEVLIANEEFISSMSRSVAIADDQLRPALGKLAAVTGDVAKAQSLLGLAADLAAYKQVSLETATNAIAKAQSGQFTSLTRLVPEIRGASDLMGALADKTANAAKIAAEQNPFARIKVATDEAAESLGKLLIPYIENVAELVSSKDFTTGFSNLTVAIGETINQFDRLFKGISGKGAFQTLLDFASSAVIGISQIAFAVADTGESLGYLFTGQFDKFLARPFGSFFTRYNKFVDDIYKKQAEAAKAATKSDITGSLFGSPITPTDPIIKNVKKVSDATKKSADAAKKAAQEVAEALAKETEALSEFSKELMALGEGVKPLIDLGREIGQFEQTATSGFDAITESIQNGIGNGTIIARAGKNLLDYVATERKALTAIARQRDELASKRSLAQALIGDVKDAVRGFASITELVNQETGNLVSNFTDVVTRSKEFASQLKQLRELGLDKNLYKQIVDAGLEAGSATAAEIIKGGAGTVGELNNLFAELERVGEAIAEDTALVMFNNGVEVAGGLVAGLMSQEQALVDAATALADAFTSTFNSMITNLKVPSQEFEQITFSLSDIAAGNAGVAGANSSVTRRLAGNYLRNTQGQGAQTITINVRAGLGTDGKAVGQAIQAELNKYNRSNVALV
jgi:phage host-nuclease inhibitor protein Gam